MDMITLLQVAGTAVDTAHKVAAVGATAPPPQELSVVDLLIKGGVLMIPIALLSLISFYILVERYFAIRKAGMIDPRFLPEVESRLKRGDLKSAMDYCKATNSAVARILEKGLSRVGSPKREIEDGMEGKAKVEIYNLEKGLNVLAAVAALAPMFGFLGTVLGMIKAFHQIELMDSPSIGVIAGGIYVKMVTSASGLIVGVMAHIFHTWLSTMIDRVVNRMEVTANDFMDIFYQPVQ